MQAALKLRLDGSMYQDHDSLNDIDQEYAASLRYALTERSSVFTNAKYRMDSRTDRDLTETGLILDAVEREQYRFSLGRKLCTQRAVFSAVRIRVCRRCLSKHSVYRLHPRMI